MKKTFVLGILFVLPLVAYLFFASGVHNFAKLPVLHQKIGALENFRPLSHENVTFDGKITVLGFFGDKILDKQGNAFSLNQKIYNKNHKFKDFQFVIVAPYGNEDEAKGILEKLSVITDVSGWKFIFGTPEEIKRLFKSLNTPHKLDDRLATNHVYIIDKDRNLRGRDGNHEEDKTVVFGYDASSEADIINIMSDDVKVILAEYRLELKKYNVSRKNRK